MSLISKVDYPIIVPPRDPNLFPPIGPDTPPLASLEASQTLSEQWTSQSTAGTPPRAGPEPILPEDSDEMPFSTPAPLQVRNGERDSLSTLGTPGFEKSLSGLKETQVKRRDFADATPHSLMPVAPLYVPNLTERRALRAAAATKQ